MCILPDRWLPVRLVLAAACGVCGDHRRGKARMTEGPLPDREQPLNVNLRRNPALSAITMTPGGDGGFTAVRRALTQRT
jgi:hypothetical protein